MSKNPLFDSIPQSTSNPSLDTTPKRINPLFNTVSNPDLKEAGSYGIEPDLQNQETFTQNQLDHFKAHPQVDTRIGQDTQEQLGQQQSKWDKVGNGIVRLVGTTGTKLGEGIGYIGGFGAWAANGFSDISAMTDNAWSKTFQNWEDSLKSNMPIYTPTSVSKGGLWDHVSSTSFWMDQGVDGAAYMLSAMVPGLALSKVAKLGAVVAGLAEGVEAEGVAAKATTIGNTMLSTISEAAQEAKGVQDQVRSFYKSKILSGEISHDDVEKKAAEAAKNDFIWNAGILMVPNFLENRFFFGKMSSEKKIMSKLVSPATGDLVDESSNVVNNYTKKNLAKNIIKQAGIGVGMEGLWEENVQLSIQNYYQNVAEGKINNKEDKGSVYNIAKGLYDNLFTEEGKESIFLGGIMGLGGGAVGAVRETAEEKEILNGIQNKFTNIAVLRNQLKDAIKNKYEKNDDGTIKVGDDGKPIKNVAKVGQALSALVQGKQLEDLKRASQLSGNHDIYDLVENDQFTGYALSMLNTEDGLDNLHKQIDTLVDQGMEEFKDPKDQVKLQQIKQEYKEKANKVAEIHDVVKGEMKSWKSPNKDSNDFAEFLEYHKAVTVSQGSRSEMFKNKLLASTLELLNVKNKDIINNEIVNTQTEIDKQKEKQITKRVNDLKEALKDSNEKYKNYLDEDNIKENYKEFQNKKKDAIEERATVENTVNEAKDAEDKQKATKEAETKKAVEKTSRLQEIARRQSEIDNLQSNSDDLNLSKEDLEKLNVEHNSLEEEKLSIENPNYLKNRKSDEEHLSHNNLSVGSKVDYTGTEHTIDSIDIQKGTAVIKTGNRKVTLNIKDLKPFKEASEDDLQDTLSEFVNAPEGNVDNENTAKNQEEQTVNQRTDPFIPNVGGKTVASISSVLMYKQFEHKFVDFFKGLIKHKVFTWKRDEEGLPIVSNTTGVNTDLLNNPNELLPGTEVEFRIVELNEISKQNNELNIQDSIETIKKHISEGNSYNYSDKDNYGFGNGEPIGIYKGEELIGFYQLPGTIPMVDNAVDYISARNNIIVQRKLILEGLKKGKVTTKVSEKGNGNLYNKLTSEGKIDTSKNGDSNLYINIFTDDVVRESDKVNNKPIFVVSNGDYLVLPDMGLTGTKRENTVINEDIKNSINNFPKWGKKGQPFILVKTVNNTWYPAPIYSTPINDIVGDKIIEALKTNQYTKELNTIVQALQPYVYVKISKSAAVKIFQNKDRDIILKVAAKEFKLADMNYEDFKETLIKNKIKQNINLKDINLSSGQQRMSDNGTLTTNIKQYNGEYLVQPYIELERLNAEEPIKLIKDSPEKIQEVENKDIVTEPTEFSLEDLENQIQQKEINSEMEEARKRLEEKGFNPNSNEEDYKTEKKTDHRIKKIDFKLEAKHIQDILPGLIAKEVTEVRDSLGNILPGKWGSFKGALMQIMSISPRGTGYHEAFHGLMDMLSPEEKLGVFNEAKKRYKSSDLKFLEEAMADDFGDYTSELTYEKSLIQKGFQKIADFFRRIANLFGLFIKHGESKIDKLFYEVNQGKFAEKSIILHMDNDHSFPFDRYSLIPGISSATKLEFIQYIGNEFIKQYFDLKNSGVTTENISVNLIYSNIKKSYKDMFVNMSKMENPDMRKIGLLDNIINNFDLFRKNTDKYLKSVGIKVGDKIVPEMTEESNLDDLQTDPENLDTQELGSEFTKGFKDWSEIPGLSHASVRLKLFLSGIAEFDSNGNPKLNAFDQPIYTNFHKLYYAIENSLIGTYDFNEQIEELRFLATYKPELNVVADKLEKGWEGITPDELLNIQNDFKTNFSKQQMAYMMVTFSSDPKTGNITYKTFESNRRTLRAEIQENWENNLLMASKDTIVDFKGGEVEKLTGTHKAIEVLNSWNEILKEISKPNTKLNKQGVNGILKKLGIDLSDRTLEVLTDTREPSFIASVTNIINYFNKPETNDEDLKGYKNNLKIIAEFEVKANPTRYSASFVNGEMKNIYTVQLPSYASKLLQKLGNTNRQVFEQLIDQLQKDPSYQHVSLLTELMENEEFRKSGFKMFYLDSLKDSDSKSEGSKFTKLSDKDFYATSLALFQNMEGNAMTVLKKKTAKYTYLTPADKQELMLFNASVYDTIINPDGKFDSKSPIVQKFYNIVLSEASRIQQQIEIKKKVESGELDKSVLLKNYHYNGEDSSKFDGRAFKFQIFESLNKELYNDIVKALESGNLTRQALSRLQDKITETIIEELNNNLKDAYQEALDKEIIGLDSNNQFINKVINTTSKEFASKNSKDHQIKEIIGNFFLNSFVFNVEMSKILNGDPAIYKDLFKRTYQSGGKTKYGNMGKSIINTIIVKDYTHRSELLKNENFSKAIEGLSEEDQDTIRKELANSNITDAQSEISPELWKSILIANAEWTKDHEELFEIMEEKVPMPNIFPAKLRGLIKAIKPFYFGHRFNEQLGIIQHEQVKTSMMPLFKLWIKDSPLWMEHRKMMDEKGVDMVAFESTFKAAMPFRENVREPKYKEDHIVPLDSNNFGIQVDNPDHSYESENSSMRQLKMQLPGNIPQDMKFGDRTGLDLRNEILRIESSIVNDASNKLLKDILTNEKRFNELMQEALTSRNSTENIEKLLEIGSDGKFKNNIALGPFIKDIEYLISSIWSKKVIKQAFEGGNLVQATSFGFRFKNLLEQQKEVDKDKDLKDIQSRLKHITPGKNGGQTEYAEAVMPAWSRDFFNEKGFLKSMEDIPEELREMIIYRIPTEGYHSMLPVKVVSFLPEGYGNFMLLPYEITTQFGADFDFDKVFFAVSSHEMKDGKTEKVKYDPEKPLSDNTKEQKNNRILDLYKEVLRHPDIYKYMIKPSGFEKQKAAKAKLKGQLNQILKEQGKSTEDPNFYSPIQQRNLKTRNHINIALKGQAANDVSGHAYTAILGLKTAITDTINYAVTFNNDTRYDLSRVTNDNGELIGDELGSNLAAILDDLKSPILAYLNINNTTINILNTIIRLGFDFDVSTEFITQPSIVELAKNLDKNKQQQKDSKQGFYSLDSTIIDYSRRLREIEKILGKDKMEELKNKFRKSPGNPDSLNTTDLSHWRQFGLRMGNGINIITQDNIDKNPDIYEYYVYQNKVLAQYKKINDIKDALVKLNRLFGVNNAAGPGYEDILDKEAILSEIQQSNIFEKFDMEANEALSSYYNANIDALTVFKKYLPYDNSMYRGLKRDLASKLAKNLRTLYIKTENRDKFNRFINGSLIHQFFNTSINDIDYLFKELPVKIQEMRRSENKQIKNNPLIQELDTFKKDGLNFINLRSNTYMPFIKDSISEGWNALYRNPETKQIAIDLVKYSLFATNFYSGLRSFHNMIPVEILQSEGLNEFMDDNQVRLNNNIPVLTSDQQERLQDQFIRNNAKLMTKIINEEIFTFDGNFAFTNKEAIQANSQKDNMILMEETDGENIITHYTQYIRIKDATTNKRLLYKFSNKSDNNQIIYERITMLGKPGYLMEVDLNNNLKSSKIGVNNVLVQQKTEEVSKKEKRNFDIEDVSYEEVPAEEHYSEDNDEDEGTPLDQLVLNAGTQKNDAENLEKPWESVKFGEIWNKIIAKDPTISREIWENLSASEKLNIINCL